jgi:dTDP-4-amino-4,6-dideoxygalactose transaminase
MAALALRGGKPVIEKMWAGWPVWDRSETAQVQEVVESGRWGIGGKKVAEFAARFSRFQHAKHTLPVANGTLALELALEALDIGAGDEVIVPDYTFMATVVAPLRRGAVPVLVDVDPDTYCIDPALAARRVSARTKAVIPVHLGGHPCDMTRIMALAEKYGLSVIEDCAHAHGASWDGTFVGSFGDIGTFSLQASKTLNCGEGGAVVTSSDRLYRKMWALHNAGRAPGEPDYNHYLPGTNYRITELQAGLLLAQMERLEAQCDRRDRNSVLLNGLLSGIDGVKPQGRHPKVGRHGHYLYLFTLENGIPREPFKKALQAEGVPVQLEYPALHTLECIRTRGLGEGSFPHADRAALRSVWLYHHALLGGEEQTALIAQAVKKVLDHKDELS